MQEERRIKVCFPCFVLFLRLLMLFAAEPLNLGLGAGLVKYFLNVK